jgi:hypothetical protein
MYTLQHKTQKSTLDSRETAGPIGHIFICDCRGLLLPVYRQERQKMPACVGDEGYSNGCLSGVRAEVGLLL